MKIAGTGEGTSLDAVAKFMTGAEKEELQNCETGKFFLKVKSSHGFLRSIFVDEYARPFRVTTSYLGFRHAMKPKAWEQVKAFQLENFYRPLRARRTPEIIQGHTNPSEYGKNSSQAILAPHFAQPIHSKLPL